jgi:uncharacterized protein (DUF2237 family)
MRLPAILRPRGRHRAVPTPAPAFTALEPGARWLVCDTTTCGHMTTRHLPADGGYRCSGCNTFKGEQ